MKKILLILLGMVLCTAVSARPARVEQGRAVRLDRRTAALSFTLRVPQIGRNERLTVTPYLAQTDTLCATLRPVAVMGHDKNIASWRAYNSRTSLFGGPVPEKTRRRALPPHYEQVPFADSLRHSPFHVAVPYGVTPRNMLSGKPEIVPVRHRIRVHKNRTDSLTVSYRVEFPYEAWMSGCDIGVRVERQSCCRDTLTYTQVLDRDCLQPFRPAYDTLRIPTPMSEVRRLDRLADYLYPEEDFDYMVSENGVLRPEDALIVHFRFDDAALDTAYRENAPALDQITQVLDVIKADPDASLARIVLAGKASPEGSETHNKALAQRRADALCGYLQRQVTPAHFHIFNEGEDWDGLRRYVLGADMPERDEVLEIIDRNPDSDRREAELRRLDEGKPYKYLSERVFPDLRSAGYVMLFYRYQPRASLYRADVATDEARIAWAIDLIGGGNYRGALQILSRAKNSACSDNLRGVCYMMLFDFANARFYLRRAVAQGDINALENLCQIDGDKPLPAPKPVVPVVEPACAPAVPAEEPAVVSANEPAVPAMPAVSAEEPAMPPVSSSEQAPASM